MAGAAPLVWLATALGVAGVVALRLAWSRERRSPIENAIGWTLLLSATVLAAQAEGAWGVSIGALAAMLMAFAFLAVAGARSPARVARGSSRRAGMLPESGEPRRIGRRFGTFALTIVAGFAVAIGLAMFVITLGGWLGWSAANANALALFSVPITWGLLVFAVLMQASRRRQAIIMLACCVPIILALLSGVAR